MSNREEIICDCFSVSRGTIEDAIREKGLKTVEQVGEATDAGTGCGGCQEKIGKFIEKNERQAAYCRQIAGDMSERNS